MSTTDTSAPLDTTALSAPDSEAVPSAATTTSAGAPALPVDLSDPIWTIHHLARALHLSVDRAREFTYTADFPAPRGGFSRNLWLRPEVLDWFATLPTGERRAASTATRVRHEAARERRLRDARAPRARRGYTPQRPR
jgi:hypothetical protein